MYKNHFLQSPYWASVREQQGWRSLPVGQSSLLIKPLPLGKHFGYMPQVDISTLPWAELVAQGKSAGLTHIQLDIQNQTSEAELISAAKAKHPLHETESTYYRFTTVLDLPKTEEELLAAMKPKTRYNIGIARKNGVKISIGDSDDDFGIFIKLFFETVKRQNYFGRDRQYYEIIWNTLKPLGKAKIAIASYQGQPLVAWMLFLDDGVIYYPYGGSSVEHRNVMATYGLVWEIMRWGKENGYQYFDLWGTLGPNPDEKSPEFGFHRFKMGFGGAEIAYLPAYDLIINPLWYRLFKLGNKMRWLVLRLQKLVG